jgi:hypothetical protein
MRPIELATYLYCLAPSGPDTQGFATGLDEHHPVLVRVCGETRAVYSQVELGEFLGESAEAHLQDLAWLGPKVFRHEAVIERFMSQSPVLPACFATLFSSLDSLEQFVLEHRNAIAGFFSELGTKQEWAVKGLPDRAGALDAAIHPEMVQLASSPGTRYFQEKRIKVQVEREFNQRLKEFCRRAAAALGTHAGGFRERKVLNPAIGGTEAAVVLNWAFLIPLGKLQDFRGCLQQLNNDKAFPNLTLTLSGPWPPYSFVPDLSAGAEA